MIIGDWQVDAASNEIRNRDEATRLSPLAMDVLLHLASRPGEVIDTNELIEKNWPANKGSDNTLYKVISELRRNLNDKDRKQRKIESVAKRGYRLTLSVKLNDDKSTVGQTTDQQALLDKSVQEGRDRLATRNYTLAVRHFEVALNLCRRENMANPDLEADLCLLIGHCLLQEQGKDTAEPYFVTARDLALDAGNHSLYARALLGLSGNLQPFITGAANSLTTQLKLAYRALPNSEQELALRLRARIISYSYPLNEEMLEEAEQVVQEAREIEGSDILIYSLLALHECLRSLGFVERQTALSAEIFELAQVSVDRDLVIVGYLRRISDFLVLGRRGEAEKLRLEMEALQPRILFQDELSRAGACFAILNDQLDEAEQQAMAISFRESGYLLMQFLQLITIARLRGESENVLPLVESIAADYADLPAVSVYLALLYADVGQKEACLKELANIGDGLLGLNQDISWHAMLVALTETALIIEDVELAKILLEKLLPHSGFQLVFTTIMVFGPADFFIGVLQDMLQQPEANDSLQKALEQAKAVSHQPLLTRLDAML